MKRLDIKTFGPKSYSHENYFLPNSIFGRGCQASDFSTSCLLNPSQYLCFPNGANEAKLGKKINRRKCLECLHNPTVSSCKTSEKVQRKSDCLKDLLHRNWKKCQEKVPLTNQKLTVFWDGYLSDNKIRIL